MSESPQKRLEWTVYEPEGVLPKWRRGGVRKWLITVVGTVVLTAVAVFAAFQVPSLIADITERYDAVSETAGVIGTIGLISAFVLGGALLVGADEQVYWVFTKLGLGEVSFGASTDDASDTELEVRMRIPKLYDACVQQVTLKIRPDRIDGQVLVNSHEDDWMDTRVIEVEDTRQSSAVTATLQLNERVANCEEFEGTLRADIEGKRRKPWRVSACIEAFRDGDAEQQADNDGDGKAAHAVEEW